MFAQRRKELGLFDGVNTQVGFHIQVNIQHIFGVTRLVAHHFDHFFCYRRLIQRGGFRGRGRSGGHRSGRSRRAHGRGGFGFMRVDGVYFIHKRLGAFHHQGGFHAVAVVVFNAKGVLHHFQHRSLLAGNFFQPRFVFGLVRNARFAFLPHFFK